MDSQAGLPDEFWAIIERHRSSLMNQAVAMLGRVEDAEDVVQETFAEAFRHSAQLAHAQSLAAWLRGINRANALDRLRAQRGESSGKIRKQREAPGRLATTGGFSRLEAQESVARAIEKLPPELRDVIVLHHWEHLTYDEIARRLNVSPVTVRRRLYSASTLLFKSLRIHFPPRDSENPADAEEGRE